MLLKNIILSCILSLVLYSSEYALVVSQKTGIKKLSMKQARDLFMMKRHFINDTKVIPVNLPASLELRTIFEKKVLKIHRDKLNSYWVKQHFQGIRPPVVQSSVKSMKLFIKNVDGAIGYLPISIVDSDLRIVGEF